MCRSTCRLQHKFPPRALLAPIGAMRAGGGRASAAAAEAAVSGALPPLEHPFWKSADAPETVLATIEALAADAAAVEAELEAEQARAVPCAREGRA